MKKFLAILLSALLVAAVFAIPASAATWQDNQVVDDKGDYTFDNAYGYVFKVNHFNTAVNETITISTSEEGYGTSNPNWAINVLLCPTDDANVYTVGKVVVCPQSPAGGIDAGINFDNGNIAMVVHSAYSNPNGANWEAKVAAMALKEGDKVTLADINVADETLGDNPTITVQDDPAGAAPVAGENVAAGKPYTAADLFRQGGAEAGWGWDENAAIAYPDEDNKTMTDGTIAATDAAYTDEAWAGWNYNTPGYSDVGYAWITVDLGEATDLAKFVAYIGASGLGSGIGANNMTVAVAVSNDGENFEVVGEAVPEDDASVSVIATTIELDKSVNAQYVQFRFVRGGWMFVSEVEVYNAVAGSEEVPAGPIYVEKVVSSYKDYTHSTLYRQLTVDPWGWDENSPIAYPDDELKEKLTNGAVAKFDGNWDNFWADNSAILGFHGSTEAVDGQPSYEELGYNWIQVDLGAAANLNKFTLTAHNFGEADCVNLVKVFVSSDNETWTEVGSDELEVTGDQKAVIELDEAVSAQYVEYRFSGGAHWQFVSEVEAIEVVERNTVNDATAPVTGTETPAQGVDAEVIVWAAGEEDRVVTSDEANLRYSWFIITDAEGAVVQIGNNLVKASEGKEGFITEVTVPAGGNLIVFTYWEGDGRTTNVDLMNTYNDILLVNNNGAAIYNTVIDVESDYIVTVADGEVAIDCTAQSTTTPGGSDDDENKKPGDMSNMIVFALLAVVAIAGSAVVIKTRR